jgi:hypothetical protein
MDPGWASFQRPADRTLSDVSNCTVRTPTFDLSPSLRHPKETRELVDALFEQDRHPMNLTSDWTCLIARYAFVLRRQIAELASIKPPLLLHPLSCAVDNLTGQNHNIPDGNLQTMPTLQC